MRSLDTTTAAISTAIKTTASAGAAGGRREAVQDNSNPTTGPNPSELDSPLLEEWTFSPEKGNVIFASALDCWGFGLVRFSNMWARKLGVNKVKL